MPLVLTVSAVKVREGEEGKCSIARSRNIGATSAHCLHSQGKRVRGRKMFNSLGVGTSVLLVLTESVSQGKRGGKLLPVPLV